MLQKELAQEIENAIKRDGFSINGDTWKKDNVAYVAVRCNVDGAVSLCGRIFIDDGTSYTFTSAPLSFECSRETFATHIADKFLEDMLKSAKILALSGELPIYERKGAL